MRDILIKIIVLILILLCIFSNVYVVEGIDDPTVRPDLWKPSSLGGEQTLTKKAGSILGVINVVGVVSSVICLMVLGIKYMLGSVEEKADYKNAMIPYLIGAILVFSATTIPNILYQIAQNI